MDAMIYVKVFFLVVGEIILSHLGTKYYVNYNDEFIEKIFRTVITYCMLFLLGCLYVRFIIM